MPNLDYIPLRRALISVFDKEGLKELGSFLAERQVEIISTGGTARFLREQNITVIDIAEVTDFPEMMDGRVKTLHPKIHGALLARRNDLGHQKALAEHDIRSIDLVVVNLYPFERVAQQQDSSLADLIENIDIGGPSMLRSAAKNFESVVVLSEAGDYAQFMQLVAEHGGVPISFREQCAIKAFTKTSTYDETISRTLQKRMDANSSSKPPLLPHLKMTKELRYGENPHQKASIFAHDEDALSLAKTAPLQGKELSYNNLLDTDAALFALRCMLDGRQDKLSCAVIIKHGTPCGAALDGDLRHAFKKALACDSTSAFGGIVALSHEVSEGLAEILAEIFFEVLVAPGFSPNALQILSRKKDLRLFALNNLTEIDLPRRTFRSICGGFLMQDHDRPYTQIRQSRVVTKRAPSEEEWQNLDFAFRLSIPCRSNAIVFARDNQLVSLGAGQTSRVDAVKIAIQKALDGHQIIENAALGSDAFFPFADGVEIAARAGIRAIAQPGGSKRDAEVIAAADAHDLAMVFTGERHFRH